MSSCVYALAHCSLNEILSISVTKRVLGSHGIRILMTSSHLILEDWQSLQQSETLNCEGVLQVEYKEAGEGEQLHMGVSAHREIWCRDGDWSVACYVYRGDGHDTKPESVRMWRSMIASLVWKKESTIVQSIEKQSEIPHRWSEYTCGNHRWVRFFTILAIIHPFCYHQLAQVSCFM